MRTILFGLSVFIACAGSIATASTIAIALTHRDLRISGEFPVQYSSPLVISGFDSSRKPYKLTVHTSVESKGVIRTSYFLDRAGELQEGSILLEIGKTAKVYSEHEKDKSKGLKFEAIVTN